MGCHGPADAGSGLGLDGTRRAAMSRSGICAMDPQVGYRSRKTGHTKRSRNVSSVAGDNARCYRTAARGFDCRKVET
jgi:hypothetical protein